MVLNSDLIKLFPSETFVPEHGFREWVANNVSMEQALAVCGFLFQDFIERDGFILRNNRMANKLILNELRFGLDKKSVERYVNLENISEFFLLSADASSQMEILQINFAKAIGFAWEMAAGRAYPGRRFESEVVCDLYDESGVCVTICEECDNKTGHPFVAKPTIAGNKT